MNRLNFGSAFDIHDGWSNVDKDDHGQDVVADVLTGLSFEDDYFDYIVANHSIQMIRFDDLPRALAELRRVLKPGGVLRILVPDALRAIHAAIDGRSVYFPIADELAPTVDGKLLRYLFWHGDTRSAFTTISLIEELSRASFRTSYPVGFGGTKSLHPVITALDSREGESLIVEAVK